MHALIIEDEAMVALAIEDALRDCGCFSFDLACTADEAVAAAKARCPDLITSDVRLAPGCGIDAVDAICAGRPIPVIFITGTPSEVEARRPHDMILHKPFNSARLAEAVRRVLPPAPRQG
ncbi:MAG TPA: response regulator [Allosphingosinicella sp.]|jgi:CheY-like chemotaxis protein